MEEIKEIEDVIKIGERFKKKERIEGKREKRKNQNERRKGKGK